MSWGGLGEPILPPTPEGLDHPFPPEATGESAAPQDRPRHPRADHSPTDPPPALTSITPVLQPLSNLNKQGDTQRLQPLNPPASPPNRHFPATPGSQFCSPLHHPKPTPIGFLAFLQTLSCSLGSLYSEADKGYVAMGYGVVWNSLDPLPHPPTHLPNLEDPPNRVGLSGTVNPG